MSTRLDHLIIAARDLAVGRDYIATKFGVTIPPGGEHAIMGTHNLVMSLGTGVYLEVIAINPQLPPPSMPRWFGLDDPTVRQSIAAGPRLLTWAVNTDALERLTAASPVPLGQITTAQRDNLKWKVALPEDGRLLAAGFLPLCIQWLVDFHPATNMADLQCRLARLVLYHPRARWLRDTLAALGIHDEVEVQSIADNALPKMEARIQGPNGMVTLCSH